jgi:hypothetical protein
LTNCTWSLITFVVKITIIQWSSVNLGPSIICGRRWCSVYLNRERIGCRNRLTSNINYHVLHNTYFYFIIVIRRSSRWSLLYISTTKCISSSPRNFNFL